MLEVRIAKAVPAGRNSLALSIDLEFQAGAGVVALFGGSGAGKTLALNVIAGFVRPDSGRILLDDRILFDGAAHVHLKPRARNCGYVLPDAALFPHMTLRQNLVFAADRLPRLERHRRVSEMIERFALRDAAGSRPQAASFHERKRCALARALVSDPRLLLMDEPGHALDPLARADFHRLVREVRSESQIPILVTTSDLEECFQLADEMLVLREGRIAQRGRPREIVERPANVEVARLLGLSNLFQAEILALDPGRNTSRLRFQEHELTGMYFPGHLLGDRVWLCARVADLRASARNGVRPQTNQIAVSLIRVSELPQSVRLEFTGGISAELPRKEYEQQKDNKEWLVEFPPDALRVL